MVERLHRWIKERLKVTSVQLDIDFLSGEGNWDDFLPVIEYYYNNTRNKMTGYAPFELVFGTDVNDPLVFNLRLKDTLRNLAERSKDSRKPIAKYLRILKTILDNKTREADQTQDRYDRSRKKTYDRDKRDVEFRVGDYVLLYIGDRVVGNKRKLMPLYDGPFVVIEKKGINYKIKKLGERTVVVTVHVSKLIAFRRSRKDLVVGADEAIVPVDSVSKIKDYEEEIMKNHYIRKEQRSNSKPLI